MTQRDIQNVKAQHKIIGASRILDMAIERAMRVAPVNLSVLITGESGVGKDIVPRIIHNVSPRKTRNYFAVNCGAFPDGTIDSNLFGHVKGAFTGADRDHDGYFQVADGGTIFLDEVAEMPMSTQVRLLRVLENGEFIKVGSSQVQKTNVRVVAATNKDLLQAISEGKFREDLYYRLSTVQIHMPSLKERGSDDILLLSRFFARNFADNYRRPAIEFTNDARKMLAAYEWPGNVRQLKNVIEQVSLFSDSNQVDAAFLRDYMPAAVNTATGETLPATMGASTFDYTHDRNIIFSIIGQLTAEINQLKQFINERPAQMETAAYHGFNALNHDSAATIPIAHKTGGSFYAQEFDSPAPSHAHAPAGAHKDVYDDIVVDVNMVKTLDETERETIAEALKRNKGKRKRTADELKISERTLYRKIKQYNLEKTGTR
ncbi:MAG: sigma-54 dependent transcriptional regulator [Muribaculaceae bacterium]|nr:sigma-54 dependent transcriptional regulator [Muribaculaceae bacterium]